MERRRFGPGKSPGGKLDKEKMDRIVAEARKSWKEREGTYREQSLKIHPWVCARCGREFDNKTVHLLTVHHRDHNHENNPPDGSNWENLCIYCHENEHRRHLDEIEAHGTVVGQEEKESATHKPFANLQELLNTKK